MGALGGAALLGAGPGSSATSPDPVGVDPAPLDAGNTSVARVADKLLPSVVQIRVETSSGSGSGSGFVLDGQGHVVTNAHVVRNAGQSGDITVVLADESRRQARLVGVSAAYDLAVLEVRPDRLRPARIGSSAQLRVGQAVVAFGSPLGLTSTVTSGIVSALDRPVTAGGGDGADASSYINAVQTDAAINPGNSGGPLVDLRGRVVGVNSAIATVGASIGGQAGNIGVGFAIPIDQVRLTAAQLIERGEAVYPVIGAQVNTAGQGGAVIDEVVAGSPAEAAGLRAGDLVVMLDGERVEDGIALIVAIRAHAPGDTVTFVYVRDDERVRTRVVLDAQQG
jgi:putative serine protease PepD